MKKISIFLNEEYCQIESGITAGELRDHAKPDHDVIIINGFPSGIETVIRENDRIVLIKRGLVPSAGDIEALLVSRHTPGVHRIMKKSVIGIAGIGGLGSSVAIALSRMGVGKLILADYDVVEPSNLNRQQYYIDHIGLAKTTALAQILKKINPYNTTESHQTILDQDNIFEIFSDVDVLIECFDHPASKVMIINTATKLMPDIYVIGASGVAGYGDSDSIRIEKIGARLFMVGDFSTAARAGQGLMATRVGIAAHIQANLAVSLLMETKT